MHKLVVTSVVTFFLTTGFVFSAEDNIAISSGSYYTIKYGDTLWKLAGKFYNNSWQWEGIWKANPQITNPDKILEGTQLLIPDISSLSTEPVIVEKPKKLTSTTEIKEEKLVKVVTTATEESKPKPSAQQPPTSSAFPSALTDTVAKQDKKTEPSPVTLDKPEKEVSKPSVSSEIIPEIPESKKYIDNNSFLAPLNWKSDGVIIGDQERKSMISMGDLVYLDIGTKQGLKPMTKCIVYRKIRSEFNPRNGEVMGNVIQKIGVLRATNDVEENMSTARVITSYESLKIGDMIRMVKETP